MFLGTELVYRKNNVYTDLKSHIDFGGSFEIFPEILRFMRQTLFYIPTEIWGYPVFGIGIALTLLVVGLVAAIVLRYAKTRKFDEEVWSYLGLLVVGGAILVFVVPHVAEPQGLPIRGYGVCLLIAILSALALVLKLTKSKGIASETVFSLCLWAVVSGILGARLFYVAEYWREMVARDPSTGVLLFGRTLYNVVNIPDGGLVVFGSIIGGALGSLVFMVRNRLPVLSTFDAMAPAMMLGLAIGRIGCLMNGCCFGGPTDVCWAITFPKGSPAHQHQIQHGDVFFYGLTFETGSLDLSSPDARVKPGVTKAIESATNPQTFLCVKEVQPGSEAERSGILPGMVLRGIGVMEGGQPKSHEVRSMPELLYLFHQSLHNDPQTKLRFDFYSNSQRTQTRPYFLSPGEMSVRPVHPTQLYSSLSAAVLCCVLLILGRLAYYRNRPGLVFVSFLMLYAIVRFCLEMIRTDEDSFLGTGLTVSQNVSIASFFLGAVLATTILSRSKAEPSTEPSHHAEQSSAAKRF